MYIFVYGTLRQGRSNNHVLGKGAEIVSVTQTIDDFLFACGNIPYVLKGTEEYPEGYKAPVVGELWHIPLCNLSRIDDLEGHPDFYKRERVNVLGLEDVSMYIYQYPNNVTGIIKEPVNGVHNFDNFR